MPRRNKNVRQRNVPRAAQRLPKGTQRAQLPSREEQQTAMWYVGSDLKPQQKCCTAQVSVNLAA